MSEKRRHHYVPVFLLRHFIDGDKPVHGVRKSINDEGEVVGLSYVPADNPRKIFRENDLYTVGGFCAEDNIAKIENEASRVLNRIRDSARKGKLCDITLEDKDKLITFLRLMLGRTSKQLEYMNNIMNEEIFPKITKKYEPYFGEDAIERYSKSAEAKNTKQKIVLDSIATPHCGSARDRLLERRLDVVKIHPSMKRSFIAGDSIVHNSGLGRENGIFAMPISRDVIIYFEECESLGVDRKECFVEARGRRGREWVKGINKEIYARSAMVISSDWALLSRSLVEKKFLDDLENDKIVKRRKPE